LGRSTAAVAPLTSRRRRRRRPRPGAERALHEEAALLDFRPFSVSTSFVGDRQTDSPRRSRRRRARPSASVSRTSPTDTRRSRSHLLAAVGDLGVDRERSADRRDECTPKLFRALRADEEERPDDHQERRDDRETVPAGAARRSRPSGFLPYQCARPAPTRRRSKAVAAGHPTRIGTELIATPPGALPSVTRNASFVRPPSNLIVVFAIFRGRRRRRASALGWWGRLRPTYRSRVRVATVPKAAWGGSELGCRGSFEPDLEGSERQDDLGMPRGMSPSGAGNHRAGARRSRASGGIGVATT